MKLRLNPMTAALIAAGCSLTFATATAWARSEEHTSELQSRQYLVCRLLLEKKKKQHKPRHADAADAQFSLHARRRRTWLSTCVFGVHLRRVIKSDTTRTYRKLSHDLHAACV